MIEIREIKNKNIYKEFIQKQKPISFLQNFEWGEVEKKLNKEVFRLGVYVKNELIGVFQLIGNFAKRGKFLTISHGPIIKEEFKDTFVEIIKSLINFIKIHPHLKKFSFIRTNFLVEYNENLLRELLKMGFKYAPRLFVSENFWIKDLKKNAEELLSEMSKNHKKLILDSLEKPFLEIEKTDDLEKIEIFWNLYKKLAQNKKFIPYPYELIKYEFMEFKNINSAKLYFGKVEERYVSSALIIFVNDTAFYHHGASEPIKEPINYKLHWQIILDAQKMGCRCYNLWGITEKGSGHPWYGLTQFKKGFGGRLIKLMPTLDFPLNLKYYLTWVFEKLIYRNKI